jgi:hypothetical protein
MIGYSTYLLTTRSTVLLETNRFTANREIPCILWNPKVHYHSHKCLPPVPVLSQMIQFMPSYRTSWRSITVLSSTCTWTSHYILLKFFYFIACYGAVILSFNKEKLLFHCITISRARMYILFILKIWIICLFTFEFYNLVLVDCQPILTRTVFLWNILLYVLYSTME